MKKILLLILMFVTVNFCFADIIPENSTSINHYGIGVIRIANLIKIHEERDENSDIIQKIYWDNLENFKAFDDLTAENVFITYIPKKNYAFLSVEQEDEEWVQVCYDQENLLFGWIKKDKNLKYYSWANFLFDFGKKNSLYLFKDIDDKNLYSQPDYEAQIVDSWKLAKHINIWAINGNWALVKLIDYDNTQKTGYFMWRNEDGSLNAFVKFK